MARPKKIKNLDYEKNRSGFWERTDMTYRGFRTVLQSKIGLVPV